MPHKTFLAYLLVLCFKRRCPKQITVVRLKSKYLPTQQQFWAGYATANNWTYFNPTSSDPSVLHPERGHEHKHRQPERLRRSRRTTGLRTRSRACRSGSCTSARSSAALRSGKLAWRRSRISRTRLVCRSRTSPGRVNGFHSSSGLRHENVWHLTGQGRSDTIFHEENAQMNKSKEKLREIEICQVCWPQCEQIGYLLLSKSTVFAVIVKNSTRA